MMFEYAIEILGYEIKEIDFDLTRIKSYTKKEKEKFKEQKAELQSAIEVLQKAGEK